MIKVSVFYPAAPDSTFNQEYYRDTHLPMVRQRLGAAVRRAEINRGISAADPSAPPSWMASGHLYFDSVESFQSSFGPHAAEILGDIPNFTTIQPTIVVSEPVDA
jgi:uncharacterized protein (TIGR02118 family)